MNGDSITNLSLDGLSSLEAAERLTQYGPNTIAKPQPRGIRMFLHKFWGIVPWMLEAAIAIDIVLGRYIEAIVITALLLFHALLGFFQENRARRALALLRQKLTIISRVKRDGKWQNIPAEGIVPDDLVHLGPGDIVPADIKIADGQLLVDQSVLTGESLPVTAQKESIIYAGSSVVRGEASGIVTATGARTYYGKTAELVKIGEAPRRLQLLVIKIAKYLALIDIVLIAAVVIIAVVKGIPILDALPFIFILLVASVPIAMPVMFTMSAALGAQGLAKKGILVTRLSAIEDAATMDVICLDKTGTITENRLSVEMLLPIASIKENELLQFAALVCDEANQNPIDTAILQRANQAGLLENQPHRLKYTPFNPDTKRSEALINLNNKNIHIVMGEPETIAEITDAPLSEISGRVRQLAAEGARVLAIATAAESEPLTITGLLALSDPPRKDAKELIASLKNLGMKVLLITGDNEETAKAIAAKVGINGDSASKETIRNIDPDSIDRFAIFSRVFPEDKFLLVQALQKKGHVVGMTGDGVNDAPALKQADVGIAVANAADVAKSAGGIVLTQPGLNQIITAIDMSRRIYQRMKTWVLTMITRKTSIPPFLSFGVLLFQTFVINPLLMVLFMFTGDVATFSLSADRVTPSPKPDRWVIRPLAVSGFGLALILFTMSIGVFLYAKEILRLTPGQTQTLIFIWLVFTGGQAALYSARSRGFFWQKPHPGRWLIIVSIIDIALVTIMANLGVLMEPISLSLIGIMLASSILFLIIADLLKAAVRALTKTGI